MPKRRSKLQKFLKNCGAFFKKLRWPRWRGLRGGRLRWPRWLSLTAAQRQKLFKYSALTAIWGSVALATLLAWYAYGLPDIKEIEGATRRPSIILLAEDGTQFARFGDLYGEQVKLAELPKHLTQAVLSVEDRRFYDHGGVDFLGLARAMVVNVMSGRVVQGGSTITQQLAKNLFLTPERTFRRKVQEMMIAFWLEHTYSKDQILASYLNRVYLGAGTYGVDAAARVYFGKSAREVNLGEAAMLAGLLKAPSRYAPTNNPEQALARTSLVLDQMVETKAISERQKKTALAGLSKMKPNRAVDGRYFAAWVADEAAEIAGTAGQDIYVDTTLDLNLQRAAEKHVEALLEKSGTESNITQAALLSMQPNGAIRAYVGGRDYRESEYDRVAQSRRQAGSAFKPFIYLAAIEQGLTADTMLEDAPIKVGSYAPGNYDGKYHGEVSARFALAESLNTVAVRVLQQVGVGRAIRTAEALGINSPLNHDLSLALGTSDVSLMEMTTAFSAIAAGGRAVTPYAILAIRTRDGKQLYGHPDITPPMVADAGAVATLTDMLMSVVQDGTGQRARLDRQVAGKTGTTQDYRDAWFIGFTANYVTGVWLGNDDNASMKRITGGNAPAQLWHDFMVSAESGKSAYTLPSLNPVVTNFNRPNFDSDSSHNSGNLTEEESNSFSDFINRVTGGDKVEYKYPGD